MASKDEISSTEKLLDLIRGNPSPASTAKGTVPSASSQKPSLFKTLTFHKTIGIGVEIGTREIRIAKINRTSEKSLELLDYDTIAVEPIEKYDTPRLAKALAGILSRFCAGLKHADIWCCLASSNVETRCIRIPKLPKKQIPNAVFWTFSKEAAFNDQEMRLDFRLLGDVNENGMTKTQVMTFTIPVAETEALKKLFARSGYPLTGISIVPFAIQNLLKTHIVQATGPSTCCLFIGRDWSRIAIYDKGNLILSRGIKAGMHSMIEAIAEHYRHPSPDHLPPALVMEDRETESVEEQDAHYNAARYSLNRFLLAENTVDPSTVTDALPPVDIFQAILPAVERLVKQVERTIAHFCMHFKHSGVSEIFISGKVVGNPDIIAHIGSQLGLPIQALNPFPPTHPFTQKVMIPVLPAIKESFVPAIGIGLSSNDLTPNFLFTQRHRERRSKARQIRVGISVACIGFLGLLLCGLLWQENRIAAKAAEVSRLTQERDAFNVPLNQNLIMALYAKVNQKRTLITTLGDRYYSSAVMSAISQLTPANIQLISLRAEMGEPAQNSSKKTEPTLVIEGVVTGDQLRFETELASYMLNMAASPLFKQPVVKNKRFQFLDDRQVLRFSIQFVLA